MSEFEFEGDEVTDFTVQLPSATIEASEAYQRGTLMNLNVQVRVKSVRLEEDRKGNLIRKHVLVIEDFSVADVLTPAQRKALIEAAQAEAEAAQEPAENTISEQEHIEDVLEGQTTIEDHIEEEERLSAADAALQAEARGETLGDEQVDDAIEEMLGDSDDDDDHEHDWMDEEEEYTHGVRVEIPF